MATQSKFSTVTIEELLISNLAQTDAIADLLVEKGIVMRDEILRKVSEHREIYERMLKPTRH